jgi:N-acetyl-alpha-D-glucosaminyl L-malate synthase BshA
MKIGLVCYPTFGGSGVVATELGMALAQKGHEVHFISYRQPVRLDVFLPNLYFHEVCVTQYPLFEYPPYELTLTSKMVEVARYHNLDIFHVHYAIPHASAAYLAQQILKSEGMDVPFITTLHGTDITLLGELPNFKPVIAFAMEQSAAITCVSESLKRDTLARFALRNKQIVAIPNFVDAYACQESKVIARRACLAKPEEKILIHTSNFRKVKRVQDIVKVYEKIHADIACKVVLVGDGPERSILEDYVRQHGYEKDFKFLGNLTCVHEILQTADAFILPSEQESFGLSALEAMNAGVPVISSNAGGIPEVNIHGKTGFVSPIGDTDDMAKNLRYLWKDEQTLSKFKAQAKERAAHFSIANILPQYEAVYQSVLVKV